MKSTVLQQDSIKGDTVHLTFIPNNDDKLVGLFRLPSELEKYFNVKRVICKRVIISDTLGFGPCTISVLQKAMQTLPCDLEGLILQYLSFTKSAWKWLLVYLKKFTKLRELEFSYVELGEAGLWPKLRASFTVLLQFLTNLSGLTLGKWIFTEKGVLALCTWIKDNSNLTKFGLKENVPTSAQWSVLLQAGERSRLSEILVYHSFGTPCWSTVQLEYFVQRNITIECFCTFLRSTAEGKTIRQFLSRNQKLQATIRHIVFLILWARKRKRECGLFGILSKDVVKLIAQQIWETRGELVWLNLIKT